MLINKPSPGLLDSEQLRRDLQHFIDTPTPAEVPPCPNCVQHIPTECSIKCVSAPKILSSEPERYPLETHVVPLVYELYSTRVIEPCWSCEGHFDHEGKLWKIPQVSFYSAAPVYPQLLLRHLMVLQQQKRLIYPWHVVLADYGQSWAPTYNIEPNLNHSTDVHLGSLQKDLNQLAENLCQKLKQLARTLMEELP